MIWAEQGLYWNQIDWAWTSTALRLLAVPNSLAAEPTSIINAIVNRLECLRRNGERREEPTMKEMRNNAETTQFPISLAYSVIQVTFVSVEPMTI